MKPGSSGGAGRGPGEARGGAETQTGLENTRLHLLQKLCVSLMCPVFLTPLVGFYLVEEVKAPQK